MENDVFETISAEVRKALDQNNAVNIKSLVRRIHELHADAQASEIERLVLDKVASAHGSVFWAE